MGLPNGAATISLQKTPAEVAQFIRPYAPLIAFAALEKVWGRPGDAPSHAGVLCRSAGMLEGMLVAFEIPYAEFTPQKWQGKLGVPGDDKPALRKYMQQRYPGERWTNDTSAAGCLAEFCRLTHTRIAIDNQRDGGCDRRESSPCVIHEGNSDGEAASETAKALRAWSDKEI